ncbi:hypothetical protein Tco_1214509 [Tanacetum coccineum]
MANLKFCDKHNMVAYLKKPTRSEGFQEIVDFLNGSHIRYALTTNPTIYVSLIEKFWQTATVKTVDNGEQEITATVDGKEFTVTEASVRRHLQLADVEGISVLPTTKIFDQLSLMGYVLTDDKLTFQKGKFSPQWRFLIHTILHCLSPKKTAWEQFSSNIATAIICLATNRTFNFSKLIFDGNIFDKKKVIITETGIRSDLNLEDAGGTDCLPTATIFEEQARMGYEKPSQKLTFYKDFFSPQWNKCFCFIPLRKCLSAMANDGRFQVALWLCNHDVG